MDNFIQSPSSTPPTSPVSTPISTPLNSPSSIKSPDLSSESQKILDFLINCANQDKLKTKNLLEERNKIDYQSNKGNKLSNELNLVSEMTKINNTNSKPENDFLKENEVGKNVKNKIIKLNKKKKKNRCYLCNKKLTLMPIICKCGLKFCSSHRHPEDHQCTFDHKREQQNLLRDKNPQIISKKINKI